MSEGVTKDNNKKTRKQRPKMHCEMLTADGYRIVIESRDEALIKLSPSEFLAGAIAHQILSPSIEDEELVPVLVKIFEATALLWDSIGNVDGEEYTVREAIHGAIQSIDYAVEAGFPPMLETPLCVLQDMDEETYEEEESDEK